MSPLKLELINLHFRLQRTTGYLAELESEFWRNGGVCCPSCGVPGFGALRLKQERRQKRIKEIERKLAADRQ